MERVIRHSKKKQAAGKTQRQLKAYYLVGKKGEATEKAENARPIFSSRDTRVVSLYSSCDGVLLPNDALRS